MLFQEKLINKVKMKCENDQRISACMMYGSFTKGEGDRYSDVEFYIFLKDKLDFQFNSEKWIEEIEPFDLLFENEFGTEVVVFSNLVRGEFHFLPASRMDIIESFKPTGVFPDTESMFIYDDSDRLKGYLDLLKGEGPNRMTDDNVNFAFNNFVNAWLMGVNVLRRGEQARALECLVHVQKHVLQLVRVRERNVERWLNATKNLEADLSNQAYREFASITSSLDESELSIAYSNSLKVIEGLVSELEKEFYFDIDYNFNHKLKSYLNKTH